MTDSFESAEIVRISIAINEYSANGKCYEKFYVCGTVAGFIGTFVTDAATQRIEMNCLIMSVFRASSDLFLLAKSLLLQL